jgi:cytochrome c oxidase subunit 3
MEVDIKIVEEAKKPASVNPRRMALWIFLATVFILFAAWSSAFIVRRANGNWLSFELPSMFWISSAVLIASSLTMHWAYVSIKRDNNEIARLAMTLTTIFGMAFLVGQFLGFRQLVEEGVNFVGRDATGVSGSFVYVIAGVHGLHIVSGIVVLMVSSVSVFTRKANSKNLLGLELCATYWHFLDVLWLYLFVFLLLNR